MARVNADRMKSHPPDCSACAAHRAALLRNTAPTSPCPFRAALQPLLPLSSPSLEAATHIPAAASTPSTTTSVHPLQLPLQAPTRKARRPVALQHGLKTFTALVADKLRRLRRVGHAALADALVADTLARLHGETHVVADVDKNVRRRTYDALNVFTSMAFVEREGKDVVWRGEEAFFARVNRCACGAAHRRGCERGRVQTMGRAVGALRRAIERKRGALRRLQTNRESLAAVVARNLARDHSRVYADKLSVADDLQFRQVGVACVDLPFLLLVVNKGVSSFVEMDDMRTKVAFTVRGAFRIMDDYTAVQLVARRLTKTQSNQ